MNKKQEIDRRIEAAWAARRRLEATFPHTWEHQKASSVLRMRIYELGKLVGHINARRITYEREVME